MAELEIILNDGLRAVLDSAMEGIMIADRKGVFRYINPAYARITGIAIAERIGVMVTDFVSQAPIMEALKLGKPVFCARMRPKGSSVEITVKASPIEVEGEVVGVVAFCQDVNEMLRLNEELKKSDTMVIDIIGKIGSTTGAIYTFEDIVGVNEALLRAKSMARQVALSDSTVLICGESGTGKELFAHAIHNLSHRRQKNFVKINCAAIPENLLESEFFGYEKGAFTGANRSKTGLLEIANGGTVFLDEIGDMSLALQSKLLRVLQDQQFTPVGSTETKKVNIRVIAATNRNLEEMMAKGLFREDLFYRLKVVSLLIPALRERKDDIVAVAQVIITRLNRRLQKSVSGIDHEAMQKLQYYAWPGNIRELQNILETAMNFMGDERTLLSEHLNLPTPLLNNMNVHGLIPLKDMEAYMLRKALQHFGDTLEGKKKAAAALGISLTTLYRRTNELSL